MSSSRIIQGLIGASTAGLVLVHAVPNLFPSIVLKQYELPRSEVPVHVQEAFENVAHAMGLQHSEKVKLFINSGYTALSVGSTRLPGGAAIGLPRTVLYRTVDELENAGVTFKGMRLNWQLKAGKKLGDALIVDEKELKFMLAHEVSHLKNLDFTTDCFIPAWWLYFTYRAVPILVAALPPVNPLVKLATQVTMWVASSLTFLHQNTKLRHNREFLADKNAALANQEYLQGGISWTLKRTTVNTILRAMDGDMGKKLYSKEGNDLKDWSHPELSARLRKLEDLYAKLYLTDKTQDNR